MEQIFQMIGDWSPLGQGLFFLVCCCFILSAVKWGFYYMSIMIRGPHDNILPPETLKETIESLL